MGGTTSFILIDLLFFSSFNDDDCSVLLCADTKLVYMQNSNPSQGYIIIWVSHFARVRAS